MATASSLDLAHQLIQDMVQLTAALHITGQKDLEEQEVEAYATLMEQREPLVAQLVGLSGQLTPADKATVRFADMQQMAQDMATMDAAFTSHMQHLQPTMRSTIKDIKQGRQLSAAYAQEPGGYSTGLFDSKQ